MTKQNCTTISPRTQIKLDVGDIFNTNNGGSVTVISFTNKKNILVRFNDSYMYEAVVDLNNLRRGAVRNPYAPTHCGVGFIGVGQYWFKRDGVKTKAYKKWVGMLHRCYNESELIKYPTYRGCTVHPDWHDFQNFAEWYYSQEYCDTDYHLDKDLLIKGNRVYSADACTLLPHVINTILNDCGANRGNLPIGVCYNKQQSRYTASIRIEGSKVHLGYFDTIDDASEAYQQTKKQHVKAKALEWEGRIDKRVFDKLTA